MKRVSLILLYVFIFYFSNSQTGLTNTGCINKTKPQYILPFPTGQSYYLLQGNCGKHSHSGYDAFAYDFRMPIGTPVIAMRSGKVVNIREQFQDGSNTNDSLNFIIILHEDSTAFRYLHITKNGALVEKDQYVNVGDTIALSGNSGLSTEPHLHVDVTGIVQKLRVKQFLFHLKIVPIQGRIYLALAN